MMKYQFSSVLALGMVVSACGSDVVPDRGDVVVAYDFQDTALIERASVFMVRGNDAQTCADAPFFEVDGVAPEARRNLPVTGEVTFDGIGRGDFWVAWIVGSTATGTPVAFDCQDFIRVRDGEVTVTNLLGRPRPLELGGLYITDEMTFDFGLPANAELVLGGVDVACSIFDVDDNPLCALVETVNTTLSDLDVSVEWELSQSDEFVNGRFRWIEVENVTVPATTQLVTGGFQGRIPATNELEIVSQDLRINMGRVLEFIAQEVSQVDADFDDISKVAALADSFTTDLGLQTGQARAVDFDFDWKADSFNGELDLTIAVPDLQETRNLEVEWTADRMPELTTAE
ncbi:MAG: hypothetical protein AAF654_11185 [Myxococcota bacterium]